MSNYSDAELRNTYCICDTCTQLRILATGSPNETLTDEEQRRQLTCDNCGKTWVPHRLRQYHVCRKCMATVARDEDVYNHSKNMKRDDTSVTITYEESLMTNHVYRIIHAICYFRRNGESTYSQKIADALDIGQSRVSRCVMKLEDNNLITREEAPVRGGRKEIFLTETGKQTLTHIAAAVDQTENPEITETVDSFTEEQFLQQMREENLWEEPT